MLNKTLTKTISNEHLMQIKKYINESYNWHNHIYKHIIMIIVFVCLMSNLQ